MYLCLLYTSILSRVAGAGGECIEYAVDEYCAEGAAAVALCQPGIGPDVYKRQL